jgi:putative phage-type endonuclease
MKIIELQQSTPEWLNWRRTVITATEASIILGNNPYETPYVCWQRKMGLLEEKKSNDAMERGKRLEPEARDQFIDRFGIEMKPVVIESTEFNFLGASLDGLSACGRYVLEVKCGGAKLHSMAEIGEIPEYYKDQMQHQMLVTGAEKAFYYSYNGTDGICIPVLPDSSWRTKFLPKAREFWKCIAFAEAPPLQDADYRDMSEIPAWRSKALSYRERCAEIKRLEKLNEIDRKDLLELCGDHNCSGDGIKVMKTTVKGRIAYDDIPEMKFIEVEQYRKPSTNVWKILIS